MLVGSLSLDVDVDFVGNNERTTSTLLAMPHLLFASVLVSLCLCVYMVKFALLVQTVIEK